MTEANSTYWAIATRQTLAGRGDILVPIGSKLCIRTYRKIAKVQMTEAGYTPRINPFQVPVNELNQLLAQGYWRLRTPLETLADAAEKTGPLRE